VCNEFCGLGHANMQGWITVVPAEQMRAHATVPASTPASTTQQPPVTARDGATLALRSHLTEIAFDTNTLTAKAGTVTLSLTNPSAIPHNVAIKGNGIDVKGPVVMNNGKSVVTADLKPGTYTFYCSVPGHEAAGMKGTLTIEP
jgi:plastocyanin